MKSHLQVLREKLTAWLESRTTDGWTTMFRQALGFAFAGWIFGQMFPTLSWLGVMTQNLPTLVPNLSPETLLWMTLAMTVVFVWIFFTLMKFIIVICFPDKYVVECKGCRK